MYNRDNNLESIKSVEIGIWKLAVKNNTKVGKLDWQVGAALCGRLDVLKWALERGYTPWYWGDKFILNIRHLDILKWACLLYTSPSPRDGLLSRMPSSA